MNYALDKLSSFQAALCKQISKNKCNCNVRIYLIKNHIFGSCSLSSWYFAQILFLDFCEKSLQVQTCHEWAVRQSSLQHASIPLVFVLNWKPTALLHSKLYWAQCRESILSPATSAQGSSWTHWRSCDKLIPVTLMSLETEQTALDWNYKHILIIISKSRLLNVSATSSCILAVCVDLFKFPQVLKVGWPFKGVADACKSVCIHIYLHAHTHPG